MPLTQPADSNAPGRSEEWVQESRNQPEWKRLQAALNLAQGFEFLAVATEDVTAEELLGRLLLSYAGEKGVILRGFDLSNPPAGKHLVTAILEEVEQAPRPCWFWFRGGQRTKSEEAELGQLFLLLNQKRDVISGRADAPFLFALHPFDWQVFRRNAPDFWSIHHAVFRFGPGAKPERGPRGVPLDLSIGQIAQQPYRGPSWRLEKVTEKASSSTKTIGRDSEIRQITAVLLERGARLLVTGPGGIGKTSLVRAVLPKVAPRYLEGVWWIPFGTLPGSPQDRATAAIVGILGDLMPFTALPPDLERLARLFRSATNSSARLFVFDDTDPEAIEWLIPGKSSSVVVISRSSRPSRVSLEQLQLGPLTEADAVTLLLRIAPQIGDQAEEIAHLCGYNPFTLRLAAGALILLPEVSTAELISRLKQAAFGSEIFSLGSAAHPIAIPIALPERYRLLSIFVGNFDASAVAAVWGIGGDEHKEVEDTLGALVRIGFLESRNDRFELHDLARPIALSQLGKEERSLAELRHSEYFCEVLRRANSFYQEDTKRQAEGLALFDLEAHQIRAGQAWSAANLEVQEEAAHIASEYPRAGGKLLKLRLPPRELIEWLEAGLKGARRIHVLDLEGHYLRNLGLALVAVGEFQEAIDLYGKARLVAIELGDRRLEGKVLKDLGFAYEKLGKISRAIEHFEKYLAITREVDDRRDEAEALGFLGLAYSDMGEEKRAIEFYEQGLAIAREVGDPHSVAITLGNLANSFAQLTEIPRAIELSREALGIFRKIGDQRGEAVALAALGAYSNYSGDAKGGIGTSTLALERFRTLGDRQGEALALSNLGHAFLSIGETRRAVESFERRLVIAHQLGDLDAEAHTLTALGDIAVDSGNLNAARDSYRAALEISHQAGDQRREADVLTSMHRLAEMLEAAGRSEEAAEVRARLE